jgi:hypothetical protein
MNAVQSSNWETMVPFNQERSSLARYFAGSSSSKEIEMDELALKDWSIVFSSLPLKGKATTMVFQQSLNNLNPGFWFSNISSGGVFELIQTAAGEKTEDSKLKFNRLAKEWKRVTGHLSVIGRRYQHRSYLAILDMKEEALPFILEELRREPDRWFDALERLTKQNPAKKAQNFYEAVDLWIAWGIANDLIS